MPKRKFRTASNLSHAELRSLVRLLQQICYANTDGDDPRLWDPDKEWNSDTLEEIGGLMQRFGLAPDESVPQPRIDKIPTGWCTEEVAANYVRAGGVEHTNCPNCGSDALQAGCVETADLANWSTITCQSCGAMWQEIYRVVAIDPIDDKEEISGSEMGNVSAATKKALAAFVETMDDTGGVYKNRKGYYEPKGDPAWIDLGRAYVDACAAMGVPVTTYETDEFGDPIDEEDDDGAGA